MIAKDDLRNIVKAIMRGSKALEAIAEKYTGQAVSPPTPVELEPQGNQTIRTYEANAPIKVVLPTRESIE